MKRLLALIGALAAMVIMPLPVAAGGWAVTYLDPLPEHMQAGQAYTVGYWVLQHGSHPSMIPLKETGLRLTSPSGEEKYFRGMPLQEVSHFAAAIRAPHDGVWSVEAVQQPFGPYKVGELTLPGSLVLSPIPTPMAFDSHGEHAWGEIHPPQISADSHPGHTSTVAMSQAAAQLPASPGVPVGLLALATLGGVVAGALLTRLGRRLLAGGSYRA
jgi:hypothetical protein